MEQKRQDSGIIVPLLKLGLFTLLVPGSVTVWVPRWFYLSTFRLTSVELSGATIGGGVLIALGVIGYFWCALDFAFQGRGTPAPIDPPKVLVVRGLYRFIRNPMYASVLFVLLGESLLFQSWRLVRYTAVCLIFAQLFVLFYEEPVLHHKFGASYEEYCRTVPRWFPRRRARRP